jgi:hypothetical protein
MSEENQIDQKVLFYNSNCSTDYDERSINEKQFKDASTQTNKIGIIQRINDKDDIQNFEFINKKREIFTTKVNNNKKPTGRKKKSDVSLRTHSKYSFDNSIYKIKNKAFNCVILTLNHIIKNSGYRIKKIESNIFKDGSKNFNLKLLNKTISNILLLKVSSKYNITCDDNNQKIIEKFSSNSLIKEILDMTFDDIIKKFFIMNTKDFIEKYKFDNKYLFQNLKIDDVKEYEVLKNLIDKGLIKHFEGIYSRTTKKEKCF